MNLTFRINKPIDIVFEYLTDMQKFVSVHPVISKIDPKNGEYQLVHETLKLGVIPVSFTYPVTIESNYNDKIILHRATVMKLTKIEIRYNLRTENSLTIVEETLTFRSFLPVKSIMGSIFRKQHARLFTNMEALA